MKQNIPPPPLFVVVETGIKKIRIRDKHQPQKIYNVPVLLEYELLWCGGIVVCGVGWLDDGCEGVLVALMAVLRIHDILVWIRIRRSMPLTNGSGSCYFCR